MAILEQLGLAARGDVPAGNLSHGEQRLLEIAIALATSPKLILLDEPTAGMGPEDAERVKQLLSGLRQRYAMLLIEHDMDAVFRLSDRITVLVYGKPIASGTPAAIRDNEEVRRAYLGEGDEILMLAVEGLRAAYGTSEILFGISTAGGTRRGRSLLGRNGMGKTTTLPTSGHRAAARRLDHLRWRAVRTGSRPTESPAPASAWCPKAGRSSRG